MVQRKLRRKLGPCVCIVNARFGSSNDGNVAHQFVGDAKLTVAATGIDENLLYRMTVILDAIKNESRIDSGRFGEFCAATARLYVQNHSYCTTSRSLKKRCVVGYRDAQR